MFWSQWLSQIFEPNFIYSSSTTLSTRQNGQIRINWENPRWRRQPSWILENVNNSELDSAICAKFDGQMHHGHAELTLSHDQNSKPKLFLRDVIIMMNKDVYIKRMLGTLCAMMSRPTRALNLQIFMFSLCRTHLFALLSGLLICHTSPTNKLY